MIAHKELGFLKCQKDCVDQLESLLKKEIGKEVKRIKEALLLVDDLDEMKKVIKSNK